MHKSHCLVALAVSPKSLLIDRKDLKYQTNKINYGSRKNHRVSETMKTAQGFIALKAFLITEVDILIKEHRETSPMGEGWKTLTVCHRLKVISKIQEKTVARNFCSFSSEALQPL